MIRYSPKAGSEVVGIWRNMTVQDLANVLKKDVGKTYFDQAFGCCRGVSQV